MDAAAQPPWLAVALAAIATVSALGVAYVPVLVERVKARAVGPAPATPPTPEVEAAAAPPTPPPDSFDLVEEAVADAFRQRDAAHARADRLQELLDQARAEVGDLQVRLARVEARGRYPR